MRINLYALTKLEVRIAGYWPKKKKKLVFTFFLSLSIKTQKIDQGQNSAILTEAWLYFILKKTFTYRTNAGNPEQAR